MFRNSFFFCLTSKHLETKLKYKNISNFDLDFVGKKNMLLAPFLTPAETKNIVVSIRIGQEIWCLPYVGF